MLQEHVPAGLAGVDADAVCGGGRAGRGGGQRRELFFFRVRAAGTFRLSDRASRDATRNVRRTVGDDGARRRGNLELLRRVLEHRGERGLLGDAQPVSGGGGDERVSGAASDRSPRESRTTRCRQTDAGRRDAGRRETTRRTYTRNGNLGSDVSVILKETFDIITGCGRSCATRANLEVPSGSARGPLRTKSAEAFMSRFLLFAGGENPGSGFSGLGLFTRRSGRPDSLPASSR